MKNLELNNNFDQRMEYLKKQKDTYLKIKNNISSLMSSLGSLYSDLGDIRQNLYYCYTNTNGGTLDNGLVDKNFNEICNIMGILDGNLTYDIDKKILEIDKQIDEIKAARSSNMQL